MQLSLDLPEEIIRQLQIVEDKNRFVSQAILTALVQYRLKVISKPCTAAGKPQGHVLNTLALLDSAEFNVPFGDPAEMEKTIRINRDEWDDE